MSANAAKSRPATGGKDYGYANARIRGMRSRLLKREYLDGLIASPDITHLIQDLSETGYGPDLEEQIIHGRNAATVDEALKNNMVRTFRKVQGFLNAEASYLLVTLLGRWDVFNLKTILRGKQMHLSAEEVNEGLMATGQLSFVDLEALAMLDDIKAVVDTAATWGLPYASALRSGYGEFLKSGELADMELALDRQYAEWALRRLGRRGRNAAMARRILGIQVDISNLVTVFRFQKADIRDIDAGQFFLRGGLAVKLDLYMALAGMSDIDEVLDGLRGTPYGKTLDDAAIRYLEANSISEFERVLEDYLMRKALGLGVGDPLGVGVVVGYLWAKQNEITNLRIIVKGKAVGMPDNRVRGELILV